MIAVIKLAIVAAALVVVGYLAMVFSLFLAALALILGMSWL